MIGRTLSHYKVLGEIGRGGMGIVYRALDIKLDREVALKVLPAKLVENPERRHRFVQEARAAAALKHPHIAVVHEVDEVDDTIFIIMELVEGQPLSELLAKGKLSPKRVADLAAQIASGLAHAHEHGIVHRDLKPGNILVTADDQVKIIYFGLAKLAPSREQRDSDAETATRFETDSHVVLGTVPYMSPEQVQAAPLDHRTDIFSLGTVLYEMTTGRQPFRRDSASSTMDAIQSSEPTSIDKDAPALGPIIRRCLEKRPTKRFQSAADLAFALESTSAPGSSSEVETPSQTVPQRWVAGALAFFVVAILGLVWLRPLNTPPPREEVRFEIGSVPEATLGVSRVSISDDGANIVYASEDAGARRLYLRNLNQLESRVLAQSDAARDPHFLPNGRSVAFYDPNERRLYKAPLDGGARTVLIEGDVRDFAWGEDGSLVYGSNTGLWRRASDGAEPERLTRVQGEETWHRSPSLLPDNKGAVLIIGHGVSPEAKIGLLSFKTGQVETLFPGYYAQYVEPGYLVYMDVAGTLSAISFDTANLVTTGQAVTIEDSVRHFDVAANGTLVMLKTSGGLRQLVLVDRGGEEQALEVEPGSFSSPRFSPNGNRLALSVGPALGNQDIWIFDLQQHTLTPLTFNYSGWYPVWSPNGNRIAFTTPIDNKYVPAWMSADGREDLEVLVTGQHHRMAHSFSADGKLLIFREVHPETLRDIWSLPLDGKGQARPFIQEPFQEQSPALSPDGRWIAYSSNRSGRREIYVSAFPDADIRKQVSTNGGTEPVWPPGGRELYYRDGSALMAASVKTGPEFVLEKRTVLFEDTYVTRSDFTNYDVHPGGKSFLMVKRMGEASPRIVVALNWIEKLKRLNPEP